MDSKRGSSISMTALVIAILSLIVLLVTIFSMTGRFGLVARQVEACPGTCEASCEMNERSMQADACTGEKNSCCVDIYSSQSDNSE